MSITKMLQRRWQRLLFFSCSALAIFFYFASSVRRSSGAVYNLDQRQKSYPLLWKHIQMSDVGVGGVWYIPPQWLASSDNKEATDPKTIIDAADLALKIAKTQSYTIPNSDIPLIIHQTWKSTKIDKWSDDICEGVEKWLSYAIADNMAYFLWDDAGMMQLVKRHQASLESSFVALPKPVERADLFRVIVTNSIGGVYGDVDTTPLRSPSTWVSSADISPWTDPVIKVSYPSATTNNTDHKVSLILGIECDTDPTTNSYWRMGYTYPVQLTQWSLAGAPSHPILKLFLETFQNRMQDALHDGQDTSRKKLKALNPLSLTGPVAITNATKTWLEDNAGLRWNALTGLTDGGRSKVVMDTMILPITGFSPGRSKSYGNMGSKPITDPEARVLHRAQGSWKHVDLRISLGKACKTLLGLCRDWDLEQ